MPETTLYNVDNQIVFDSANDAYLDFTRALQRKITVLFLRHSYTDNKTISGD
jgi:hypothetical protein